MATDRSANREMSWRMRIVSLIFSLMSVSLHAQEILIRNANVISMQEGAEAIWQDTSVLIRDGKIAGVYRGELPAVSQETVVVDGRGKTLMPGLIDMHVHIWDSPELLATLSYGVTTVRNASGMPFLLEYRDKIEAGTLEGPRLFTTGPILNGPGPNAQINHQLVHSAEEARTAVHEHYDQGYRDLKVYSNLSRESYEAILEEARKLGLTVMGHTPEGVREPGIPFDKPFNIAFEEVLDDGLESIEHIESIVWHALADELDEGRVRELAKKIAAAGVPVDPTLVAHHNLVMMARTQGAYQQRDGVELINPFLRMIEQANYDAWAARGTDARSQYDEFYGRVLKIFMEEDVLLVTGTDAGIFINVPGLSLVDELALYLNAGVSAEDALRAATVNGATVLGFENSVGRIQEGYEADLVLLPDNPLENMRVLETPAGLLVRGRWYDALAIREMRLRAAESSIERTQQQVFEAMAIQGTSLEGL